jgi:hypothetical protein
VPAPFFNQISFQGVSFMPNHAIPRAAARETARAKPRLHALIPHSFDFIDEEDDERSISPRSIAEALTDRSEIDALRPKIETGNPSKTRKQNATLRRSSEPKFFSSPAPIFNRRKKPSRSPAADAYAISSNPDESSPELVSS